MIDLKTIDQNLARAKDDVASWEQARTVFLDPRFSGAESSDGVNPRFPFGGRLPPPPRTGGLQPPPRPYGEVKRKVLETLPEFGQKPLTTAEIAEAMGNSGFVFASRTPTIAVNEALSSLGEQVYVAGSRGLAKLWTKARPENVWDGENAPEKEIEDQQQTPP